MSLFEQERVIGRLQRRVAAESSIAACFLSGSYGRNAADDYSDLDVVLVYRDDAARDRAWAQRQAFARSVMPYVSMKAFDADHIRPFFFVTLLANGAKIDYRFESMDSLRPSAWDGRIRILKDSDGSATQYQQESSRLSFPQRAMSEAELQAIDQRFWVMFWDILRQLARGDADKPFTIYLELLSTSIPPLLQVLDEEDPARLALLNAHYDRNALTTRENLLALLEAYLVARQAVIQRFHLRGPDNQAFETELQRNIQKLT